MSPNAKKALISLLGGAGFIVLLISYSVGSGGWTTRETRVVKV